MEELIERGADVYAPGSEIHGLTALQAAASQANLEKVKILIEKYGADVNEPRSVKEGYTTLEAACCRIAKGAFDAASRFAPGSSEDCSKYDGLELIDYILGRGARVTPFALHIATAWGHLSMTRLLLCRGSRITDPPDNDFVITGWGDDRYLGQNALETAKLNGRQEVLEFLQEWPGVVGTC